MDFSYSLLHLSSGQQALSRAPTSLRSILPITTLSTFSYFDDIEVRILRGTYVMVLTPSLS